MKTKLLALFFSLFMLASCGGGGASSSSMNNGSSASGNIVRTGYSVDDYIVGGTVNIYVNGTNNLIETTTTSDFGKFTWSTAVTGVVRVEVSGGYEDIDGLSATTNDHTPFTKKLVLLMNADTLSAPVIASAITTGIAQYAAGDLDKYNTSVDALNSSVRPLVVTSDIATNDTAIKQRLETVKSTTRYIGFNTIVNELSDDGKINNTVGLEPQKIINSVNDATTQGAISVIKDTSLRTCISDKLGKATSDITSSDFSSVTSLNCDGYNITSVAGIDALSNLKTFVSSDSDIGDISPFANIVTLRALSIENNRVSKIAPLLNAKFKGTLELQIAKNCATDIALLSGSTNISYQYGKYNQQFSDCYKNDADVVVFNPYITGTGAYTLMYKATYNTAAVCSIDWGDGSTSPANCDFHAYRISHTYSSTPLNPVQFLVNGVSKKSASFPTSTASLKITPYAAAFINNVNPQLGMSISYLSGLVINIPVSTNGLYDNATVSGLGVTTSLVSYGKSYLEIQSGSQSAGDIYQLPQAMSPTDYPAGTVYTFKLYKGTTLVSTKTVALAARVLAPSELTRTMFAGLSLSNYAQLCPNNVPTTATYYTLPSTLSLQQPVETDFSCTPNGQNSFATVRVEGGDQYGRRFNMVESTY